MTSTQSFVIVGASLTGAKAAEELRKQGFDGRVVLIGEDPERPYERPPLTKDYLRGDAEREKVYVHPQELYAEQEIELLSATTVGAIDPGAGRVELGDGRELSFDRLLLATGAAPKRLPIPGSELEGVHYLRTLADCDLLRQRLESPVRIAVIGAGWIGAEFAATARQRGAEVALIEPASVPLERVLGSEVGEVYLQLHREHGVETFFGTGVEALEGDGKVARVRTDDGRAIECELVVIGVGVQPRVELAQAAGLKLDNGVVVDESLRTSAENVFAAGDVANARHPFYERSIRVEHWANALNQGPAAARAMLGQEVSYDRIPYFFSDQYDVGMEYSGYAAEWDEVLFRGDPASREFIAFWLRDGRVLAGMNVNVWDVTEPIQQLIRSRAAIDRERLADGDASLEELASQVSAR